MSVEDYLVNLRNDLRAFGYAAKLVNGDCFDIHQDGWIHYLSRREAEALRSAAVNHPVDLHQYGERNGLNLWYTFPQPDDVK